VTRSHPKTVSARPVAPPPHADFANLRRFHNYYRVLDVGEYRHHFVAFYHHLELVTALYDVPVTAGALVHQIGTGFGLITEAPAAEPIPTAVAPIAEAVKSDIMAREPGASSPLILYLGTFRTVRVEEIVVREPSKTKAERYTLRLTLAANEDLTAISGSARYYTGTGGSLRLDEVSEHADAPHWIDGEIGRQGRAQLWHLYDKPSPFPAEVRAAFDAATLAAARRLHAGEPGLTLADLATERDARVLPANLEERRPFIFYVNGIVGGTRQSSGTSWIVPSRMFGGEERVQIRLAIPTERYGDEMFEANVALRASKLPDGADGELEVPVTIDYRVTATHSRQRPFFGTAIARAHVVVDGDRVHVLDVVDGIPAHTFTGVGEYKSFEVHLGFMGDD
jgi:hypothetical protein